MILAHRPARDDRRRRVVAVLFTSVLATSTVLAALAWPAPGAPALEVPRTITMAWPAAMGVPTAPPAGGGGRPRAPRRAPDAPAAAPAAAAAAPTEAAVVPVEPAAAPASGSGAPDAPPGDGGGGGGTGTGPTRGPGDGDGDGGGGGGGTPRSVHYSEAVPERRVSPEWPEAARALGLTEARCVAHVVMDERGEPLSAEVRGCPPVFWSATRDAALAWRWRPFEADGQALRVQFDIAFEFRR